jgi:DNA-directed RNA polymerase subunit RPC12/RpoP
MYETTHTDGKIKGKINYTVWSDVFVCPECSKEVIFWEVAVDKEAGAVKDEFPCPHCSAKLTKRRMERAWTTKFDTALNESVKQAKQIPVLINYTVNGKRAEKKPDEKDFILIDKIETNDIPYWFPKDRMIEGSETRRNDPIGLTHSHHFYTKRNLYVLACLNNKFKHGIYRLLFQSVNSTLASKIVRYNLGHRGNGPVSGTLYVPSLVAETEIFRLIRGKLYDFVKALHTTNYSLLSCGSSSRVFLPFQSIDYVFIDPPFGSNINYSELNFLWESWLKVITNNGEEAIVNSIQQKSSVEYRELMTLCFREMYRILKPGHWMTIEFSNTQASIWNIIQTTLSDAGFIVANVSALDKKQGSFKAVTTPTAVKQDLVISAYKPNGGFEERFIKEADTEEGVWDFIRTHLKYLPVVKIQNKELIPVDERQPRILFDQVVAYYVRKGIQIPIASSQAFQAGLKEKFNERDGMYFLHEQALEYDKKKLQSGGLKQSELFVINEESAIQWLKTILSKKPRAIQDIYPDYMQKLTGFDKKEEKLELKTLLEQNFIEDDRGKWHVPDPENAIHVEKIREKALLKEFENYKNAARRLKIFRIEAVRAGFKKAYNDRDYETILKIADKISGDAIEEDPMLLMWYTSARTRMDES